MVPEAKKLRQQEIAIAPALAPTKRKPPAKEFYITSFVSVPEKRTVWQKMTSLLDDAKDAVARVKKGLEPVSAVSERQTPIPPEVVFSQYTGHDVLIAKKEAA